MSPEPVAHRSVSRIKGASNRTRVPLRRLKGIGVAERGIDENDGAPTSPSAIARAWTVEVRPVGSLNDVPVLASLSNTGLIDSEARNERRDRVVSGMWWE